MGEIIRLQKYPWRRADGRRVTVTQVTWRDRHGKTHIDVLEMDLSMEDAERRFRGR